MWTGDHRRDGHDRCRDVLPAGCPARLSVCRCGICLFHATPDKTDSFGQTAETDNLLRGTKLRYTRAGWGSTEVMKWMQYDFS